MVDNELIIEIRGSAKEFNEALEVVKKGASDLESQLKVLGIISGAAFALSTVEVGLATEAYGKQEIAVNALTQAMQTQGVFSSELKDQYVETAEALEKKTGVDSAAILSGQALLQSMIGQIPITDELTKATVDLSARTGIDLNSAFKEVGQAVDGHAGRLAAMGIQVDLTVDRQTRLKQITEQLAGQFDGAAESQTRGLGSIKLLHAAYDDLQKKIGEEFAPVVTRGIEVLTKLFNTISENHALVDLIVSLTAAGVVIGGLGTAVTLGGLAFLKLKEALEAARIAMSAMEIVTKGLIGATGIGLLVIILSEVYLNWGKIWPAMQGIFVAFVNNISSLAAGIGKILFGAFTFRLDYFQQGLDQIKAAFSKGIQDFQSASEKGHKNLESEQQAHEERQSATMRAFASKREALRRDEENRRIAAINAENQLVLAQANKESDAMIALKKEEAELFKKIASDQFKAVRSQLQAALADNRKLQEEQAKTDIAQAQAYNDRSLKESQRYQQLSDKQRDIFNLKNKKALQSSIDTRELADQKAAQKELQDQIASHNQLLQDEIEYGEAYAQINQAMHTKVFEGSGKAFGELANLQNSSNATLKSIGKAAAIANIVIKTSESAMNIFAGFSTIPIIGPALGTAAAAAAIAYGAEQIGQVTAAAQGGLITGGVPGRDSVPALLMPGELVAPEKSFDEVVNAVAFQRAGERSGSGGSGSSGASSGLVQVELSLKGDLGEIVEAKIIKRQKLGTSLLPKLG